ncbi:MAG: cupin domain-containing protein [Chroococcidiopsidaceae cyanobacterium CP_BM_ER_R8_30]|nr:cupin domain-containing protein [Chroococcidiopsidaceae cyanobacterium CP_BM_ER_R8_30]
MTIPQELLMKPGQGTSVSIVGDILTFKAVGEDTNGQYTLVEVQVDPDIGPPLHIHHREDETFYIQEGELEFQLGDQIIIATPGTFLYSPKGHVHRFTNKTNQRAKMLAWYMPAGIERYFAEVGVEVDSPDAPSVPASPERIEQLLAAAPKYGVEFVLQPEKEKP